MKDVMAFIERNPMGSFLAFVIICITICSVVASIAGAFAGRR